MALFSSKGPHYLLSKFLKQDIFRLGWPSSSTLFKKIEIYSNDFEQLFIIFQISLITASIARLWCWFLTAMVYLVGMDNLNNFWILLRAGPYIHFYALLFTLLFAWLEADELSIPGDGQTATLGSNIPCSPPSGLSLVFKMGETQTSSRSKHRSK